MLSGRCSKSIAGVARSYKAAGGMLCRSALGRDAFRSVFESIAGMARSYKAARRGGYGVALAKAR